MFDFKRAVFLLAACLLWMPSSTLVGQTKPNVILMIADDMAPYDTNVLGNDRLQTPNLDMLANGGLVFSRAYNLGGLAGAVCRTSRRMMMSGRYLWSDIGSANDSVGVAFSNAGYETFITSKNGNTFRDADELFEFEGFRSNSRDEIGPRRFTDSTIEFMDAKINGDDFQNRSGQQIPTTTSAPYFAQVAFGNPHDQRRALQEYLDRYGAIQGDNPGGWTQQQLDLLPDLPVNYLPQHPFDNGDLTIRDEVAVEGVGTSREPLIVRNELGKQNAVIDFMDSVIGDVLDKAEEVEDAQAGGDDGNDFLDNTIVVFTADHGIAVGAHGLMGKQNLYDHSSRVPMIFYGAGVTPGVSQEIIYLGDLFPTLLEMTGSNGEGSGSAGSADDQIEFSSLAAAVRGEEFEGRDSVYGAYVANGARQRSVIMGDFKMIHYGNINRTQLFNLADNPFEIYDQDLAHDAEYCETLLELRDELLSQMEELGDPGPLGLHVGINVAFERPTTQSSTLNNFVASNATDGAGSTLSDFTHTASDDENPFWEVDLQENHLIDRIILHNREGSSEGRLRDIQVEILDADRNVVFTSELLNPDNVLGGDVFNFQSGPDLLDLSLAPTRGAFVRVSRLGSPTNALDGFNFNLVSDEHVLSLEEVQVFSAGLSDFEETIQTTVEFQDNFEGSLPFGLAAQPEDFAVSLTDMNLGDQTGVDLVFDDVSITSGLGTYTFDLTVTPGNGVGEISATDDVFNASLAEIDAGAAASSLFEGGDVITVSVSDVQGATFDGFVNFGSDNSGTGEGINVNGIDYIRGVDTNGDADPRQGIALPAPGILDQNSVDITFIGDSVSLRGFALQFTQSNSNSFLLGDVNQDGVVNFLDISPFIGILSAGNFQIEADVNMDLEVNFLDISPFIQLLAGG